MDRHRMGTSRVV